MASLRFFRRALFFFAAVLPACGGNPVAAQIGPMPAQTSRVEMDNGSWMLAEAKNEDLVYVSDVYNGIIDVYVYGKSKQVGAIRGFDEPTGECVDKRGDVWVTEYFGDQAFEFAHGDRKPLKVLTTNGNGEGCSIDPITGDLAIGNVNSTASLHADIQVFHNGAGRPTNYYSGSGSSDCNDIQAPGYDDKGNLYFEAYWGNSGLGMCELPAKAKALLEVPVSSPNALFRIDHAGSTMWDGKYITFADYRSDVTENSTIYRSVRSANALIVVGSTTLGASGTYCYANIAQPFVVGAKNTPLNRKQGTIVVGGNQGCDSLFGYWDYPAGGDPVSETYGPSQVGGASVSLVAK
jgi:hypothetical protein